MSQQDDFATNFLDESKGSRSIETGWKNTPTLSQLKQDLKNASTAHAAAMSRVDEWDKARKLSDKALADARRKKGQSAIEPKLIRKQAEWRYPALSEPFLSTPDLFSINPVTWEDKQGADQNSLILNNQFRTQIDRVSFIDKYVRAAVNKGTVIVRTGWEHETIQKPKQVPNYSFIIDPDMVQAYQQMAQDEQTNPVYLQGYPQELQDGYEIFKQTQVPYRLTIRSMSTVMETKTVKNCPTLEVCNLKNVIVDPSCGDDLDKAKFVIYSFETSMAELKADGRYENLESINENTTDLVSGEDYSTPNNADFQPEGKSRKRIVAHEYWGYWDCDNSGHLLPIVATWVGNTLIRLEENPFPDRKVPFVAVPYLPDEDSIYGEADAEVIKENQEIAGAVMRGMIDLLGKSANSQTGRAKGFVDETNRRRMERGEDYEYNPGTNPANSVFQHTFPEVPQSAQYMLNLMNAEAESLTGVKAFSGADGISGANLGNTAAGVRGALDAASKRELSILRRLTAGLIAIGRKIIAMNAEFLDETTVVRITNERFVPVRKDDLPGNYDLTLTISTAEDDQAKSQQLAFLLQTTAQSMGPDFTRLILSHMMKLQKMPDLAHSIDTFQPQPDPVAQQQAQLQLQLLQAQINLTNAQAQAEGSKGELNVVKQGTEQAKAAHVQSQTDANSVNLLHKQTGVDHQQQMELQQAKGDTALAQQAMKQQGQESLLQAQHNSDLLKQHANADLNHHSQLQLLKAQTDLAPAQPSGNTQ